MMFTPTSTPDTVEQDLMAKLRSAQRVGELAITRSHFDQLVRVTRAQNHPKYVKKCTLVVSMVFCARYAEFADDEHIQFWAKYLHDVWGKPSEASFIQECREQFRIARAYLQELYGLEFPNKEQTPQDVVSGIYLHSILPAYLQDDFAAFFLKILPDASAWYSATEQTQEQLAQQWQTMPVPPNQRKRLVTFVRGKETSLTAARLAQDLATAALWYSEGQDKALIDSALSPLEQAIWKQLVGKLERLPDKKPIRAKASPCVRWAWLFEENDILEVHLKNVPLPSGGTPDRAIWLPPSKQQQVQVGRSVPDYEFRFCEVNAWHTDSGYQIDAATLIDIEQEGIIVAVDRHDRALCTPIPTGPLPNERAIFFRVQPDSQLAVLTEKASVTDGLYAVSYKSSVEFATGNGTAKTTLSPIASLLVPKAFKEMGHDRAGLFQITLPLQIDTEQIERRQTRQPPALQGQYLISGLLPVAMPVYEHGEMCVALTPPGNVPLDRLSLQITINNSAPIGISLAVLNAKKEVAHADDGTLRVRLNSLLPAGCLVRVDVYSGMICLNHDPLVFGFLPPNVTVRPSPIMDYYTREHPASVEIKGVHQDDIELASDARKLSYNGMVQVQWLDPRQDSALRLIFGEISIPLTFETRWAFGWVEPTAGTMLWEESLADAQLHVRGAPRGIFWITVADREPRQYMLNARGLCDFRLSSDPLYDILRDYHGEQISVHLRFENSSESVLLFKLIRPGFAEFERKPELVKRSIRVFRDVLRASRRRGEVVDIPLLCLLPWEYFGSYVASDLPRPLNTLLNSQTFDYASKEGKLFPHRQRKLRLSDTKAYDVTAHAEGYDFSLKRPTSSGHSTVTVPLLENENGIFVKAKYLAQCRECSDLFWIFDAAAKMKHRHGKPGQNFHNLDNQPLAGKIERVAPSIVELGNFMPAFHEHIDARAEYSFRMDTSQRRARNTKPADNPFTQEYYIYATAQWLLRSGFDSNLKPLRHSKQFIDQIIQRLNQSGQRELVLGGRWLLEQRQERNIEQNKWQTLDPAVMTLAFLARTLAHNISVPLNELDEQAMFIDLLRDAFIYCPELLTWALCWSEVFLGYWSSNR